MLHHSWNRCAMALLGVGAALLAAPSARAALVYSTDFSTAPGAEWSPTSVATSPNGEKFLGQFGNSTASLSLSALPTHSTVTLDFDFYAIGSWDGNNTTYGPDNFTLGVAGGPTLLNTTFANVYSDQSYPDASGAGSHPQQTGASGVNTLGYGGYGDSTYHLSYTVNDASPAIQFNFAGSGLQGINDESWGLDNVRVSVDEANAIPEPGTMALLGAGLLPLLRRRRK